MRVSIHPFCRSKARTGEEFMPTTLNYRWQRLRWYIYRLFGGF